MNRWYTIPDDVKPAGAVISLDAVSSVSPVVDERGSFAFFLGGVDIRVYTRDRDRLVRTRDSIIRCLPE